MVQLMSSGKRVSVKLEVDDSLEDQLGPIHKRSKLDLSLQQSNVETGVFPIPPSAYNPLEEPSPLGLRLKKSPSFLDLIQMKLSQGNASKSDTVSKKTQKGNSTSGATDKLKASNFPASVLKIGTWEYKSKHEGDLVAKCYFAKHKLVWEVLEGALKSKIEIQWSDIVDIKANYPDDSPATLEVVLARQPLFFRETNPQPRKHTLWQATSDFTGGQASIHRRHFLQCPEGVLGKHFEKLIQCDPRLNFISQQPEILLESLYFEARGFAVDDPNESSHEIDLKSEETFDLQDAALPCGVQPCLSENECNDVISSRPDSLSLGTPSPCSVMESHPIKEVGSSRAGEPRLLNHWDQIKVPGLHPSMSMSDLVSHIGQCLSEQMTSSNPTFSANALQGKDILEEITQILFSDSQLTSVSEEQNLISRVNSLCCLLQKDATSVQIPQSKTEDGLNVHNDDKTGKTPSGSNSAVNFKLAEDFTAPESESDDASNCKKRGGMSRIDSVGELLLNLPRIASLPQFLFNISELSDNQV